MSHKTHYVGLIVHKGLFCGIYLQPQDFDLDAVSQFNDCGRKGKESLSQII